MSTLQALSTADLTAELQRREKDQAKLQARRKKLLAELDQLDKDLGDLNGKPAKSAAKRSTKAPRPKNDLTLRDALAAAVPVGESITAKEAADAIRAAGYQTNSKNFGVQVASRLAKDERFERTERGIYKRVS